MKKPWKNFCKKNLKAVVERSRTKELNENPESEEEEGGNWVIRCVCGGNANVGLMVCCDICDVWQHASCFGLREEKSLPAQWFCEQCQPRKFDCLCGLVRNVQFKTKKRKQEKKKNSTNFFAHMFLSWVFGTHFRSHRGTRNLKKH